MSDRLFLLLMTLGLVAALLLWVPALHVLIRILGSLGRENRRQD